jgi:hypothetical protein
MSSPIDPAKVRKKFQQAAASSKNAPATEPLPLEIAQLLDVFARIEIRRQARLRTGEQEAS